MYIYIYVFRDATREFVRMTLLAREMTRKFLRYRNYLALSSTESDPFSVAPTSTRLCTLVIPLKNEEATIHPTASFE